MLVFQVLLVRVVVLGPLRILARFSLLVEVRAVLLVRLLPALLNGLSAVRMVGRFRRLATFVPEAVMVRSQLL